MQKTKLFVIILILSLLLPGVSLAQDGAEESFNFVIAELTPIAISVVAIVVISLFAYLREGRVDKSTFIRGGETLQDVLEILDRLDVPGIDPHVAGAKKAIKDMTDTMGTRPETLLLKPPGDQITTIQK